MDEGISWEGLSKEQPPCSLHVVRFVSLPSGGACKHHHRLVQQVALVMKEGDTMICSYRSTLRMLTVLYVSMASTLTLKCLSFASRPTRSAASWAVPVWLPYSTSSRLLSAEDITTSSAAAARLVKGRHRLVLSQHLLFCWLIQQYGRVLW